MIITAKRHSASNNESGFILATVILFTLVLTVVAISILSLNVSQTITGQSVVDDIKAEQLALGSFYKHQQLRLDNCPNPPCTTAGDCTTCPNPPVSILDSKSFSVVISNSISGGSNFNNTQYLNVSVSY